MPYRFGAFLLCAYSFKIHTTPHIPRTRPRIGDIAFTICACTEREQRSTAFLLFFFPEPIHCSGWGWVGASEQPYIHIVSYLIFSYRYDLLRLVTTRYDWLRLVTTGYDSLRLVTTRYDSSLFSSVLLRWFRLQVSSYFPI